MAAFSSRSASCSAIPDLYNHASVTQLTSTKFQMWHFVLGFHDEEEPASAVCHSKL